MKLLILICWPIFFGVISPMSSPMFAQTAPLKVGVIGLTHSHVHWIFNTGERNDIEIIGIVEPNIELARRFAEQYGFSMGLIYPSMDDFLSEKTPEAVTAFGNIYDHLSVVQSCAPRGIHIMVEKPLAVNSEHAIKMKALAQQHNVHLLTNYETTWYPSNHRAAQLLKQDSLIGSLRKIVVRDGHKGPVKIDINTEFLEWLTDPELNGGGALTDFGCYGANLSTWLMDGRRPNSVTAITQQLQPQNNPKVDDEAIILLQYDSTVAVIQASWNWPIGRKDMELYGLYGAIYSDNRNDLRIRISEGYDGYDEQMHFLEERMPPYDDPFAFLAAVVRGEIEVHPYELSSLENNMIVVEILDAAKESAQTGKKVLLKK